MCGIAGIVRFDGRPIDESALREVCDAMRHRGPDANGYWIDSARQSVGLAAARLAIFDPTPAGHQPMQRAGRFHAVFNGAIYNFREIRRELCELGERFESETDTEVLLAACARWGVEACRRFNGMWAFAFYDSQAREGFICRDRFGVKPLLYALDAARLAFASEMSAIPLVASFDPAIDRGALLHYIQFGWFAGRTTIYRHVRRLEPGQFLAFSAKGASAPASYYALPTTNETALDYGDAMGKLRRLLADAATCRRVADVPVGAFLSGGLDSSIIVAHLAEASARPVRTFSVGYADQAAYDETKYARLVARQFNTDHHEIRLTLDDVLDAIPRMLDHLGEPFGDSSIIPTALVSQFGAREVKVALSGDAGDELFGGYWRYLAHDAADTYARIPRFVRAMVEPLLAIGAVGRSSAGRDRLRQFRKLLRGGDGDALTRHLRWSSILAPEARGILKAGEAEAGVLAAGLASVHSNNGAEPLNRILAFDLRNQLPADMLTKVDLASMMHSLEVRVPFLDYRVVELALSLPSSFKIHRGMRKRILIDAYRGILPDEILDRPKKGFEVPVGEFLRGPLTAMFRDTVTRPAVESFDILDYDAIQSAYDDHCGRRADHADLLFALLSLCWWRGRRHESRAGTCRAAVGFT